MIIENVSLATFERRSEMAAMWPNGMGAYAVAWLSNNNLQSVFFEEDDEIADLANNLFGLTPSETGYSPDKLQDFRDTLNHFSGKWFALPDALKDYDSHESVSYESIDIGRISRVYQIENESGGTSWTTEKIPKSTKNGVERYVVYTNWSWIRIKEGTDLLYYGPYNNDFEAIKDAVVRWL